MESVEPMNQQKATSSDEATVIYQPPAISDLGSLVQITAGPGAPRGQDNRTASI